MPWDVRACLLSSWLWLMQNKAPRHRPLLGRQKNSQGYESRTNINLPTTSINTFTCSTAVTPLLVPMGVTISAQCCYWRVLSREWRRCMRVTRVVVPCYCCCCCAQRRCTAEPPTAPYRIDLDYPPKMQDFSFSFIRDFIQV